MSALPSSPTADRPDILRDWIGRYRRVFVLTGAGCSTRSGIPDYRDADGSWKRRPPVMFQSFTGDEATYRRYWARAYVGWPRFSKAQPNAAHHALAAWGATGHLSLLVTQNVDGLHQRAGHDDVVDLHGRLDAVVCLNCRLRQSRDALQGDMASANTGWHTGEDALAPDGDADIDDAAVADFIAPRCGNCGGLLKPDVVFFGENVPRLRYEQARDALLASDAMLVAGSSLMVQSGFRFARMAHEAGLPVAVVNRGRTRADGFAALRHEADVGEALQAALA